MSKKPKIVWTAGERKPDRRITPCRGLKTVNGVTYALFLNADRKIEAMPMGQMLANAGLKVRAK